MVRCSSPSSSAKSSVTNNDLLEPCPFSRSRSPFLASISTFQNFLLGQTETSSQNKPPFWPGRKRGCLGYRECFFSNFYKSDFSIFACSQIRKVGCLKSEIFKCPSCRYLPIVKYENLDFKNPRFTKIRLFDICLQPNMNIKMRCKIQVPIFSFPVKIKRTDSWTLRFKH